VTADQGKDRSALAVFAGELKLARARAGLSQDQLADKVAYSSSLVAMVEGCRRVPSRDFSQRCDEALETGGALTRLHPLVAGEAYPSWFRPFVELEARAVSLRSWQPVLVPGLLQTGDYARAVVRAARPTDPDEQISQLVSARLERQAILARDDPPLLWAVLDETVLRRPVGGRRVIRDQVAHLVAAARQPKIIIQVIPLDVGANAGMTGAFTIAGFTGTTDTVYLETAATGLVADHTDTLQACDFTFDTLRAEAISPSASLELMMKVADSWT